MDASTQPISPLRRRFIDDMTVRKLDPKTQGHYLRSVKRFADFLGRSPAGASAEDLRRFQLQLVACGTGTPTCNATLTALRFFFEVTGLQRRADRPTAAATAQGPGVESPRAARTLSAGEPAEARGASLPNFAIGASLPA